jgi:hypothetical protein
METDKHQEVCLKCALKHILNSKTFIMEAIQFGFKTKTNVEDVNVLVLELIQYIISEKGATNERLNKEVQSV